MSAAEFPIIQPLKRCDIDAVRDLPKTLPWAFVAQFEAQAHRNHSQTLKRLAERGGLCWLELLWAVKGDRWNAYWLPEMPAAAVVLSKLREWEKAQAAAIAGTNEGPAQNAEAEKPHRNSYLR